jgi:mono/diheme cytochrome c family protein
MRRHCTVAVTVSAVALLLSAGAAAIAGAKPAKDVEPEEPPTFARDVMPALGRYCETCHGDNEQHGGLRLDNYDNLMRGGDSGPAVIAGDAGKSLLLAKIEHRDKPFMPPRKWLPTKIRARIRAWVLAGAEP